MITVRNLWVLCFAVALGCSSSEGGPVGSGIASSVSGNVIEVQLADDTATAETVDLPVTLRVTIDGLPGVEALVDPQVGEFELTGELDGEVTLRFSDADSNADLATLAVTIPAGTAVVLDDLVIEMQQAAPRVVHHRRFAGHVEAIDCSPGTLHVREEGRGARRFVVRVGADTEIVRPNGETAGCAAIEAGQPIVIEESVVNADDGAIDAIKLIVAPSSRPQGPIVVRRRGNVVRSSCTTPATLHVHDSAFSDLVRIRIAPQTEIVCMGNGAPRTCACTDLMFGDRVVVDAQIEPQSAAGPEAIRITIHERPATFIAQLFGPVRQIDCSAGTLRVDDQRVANDPLVRLLEATEIVCIGGGRPAPCPCSAILAGTRLDLDVIVDVRHPESVEAIHIRARRPRP